MTEIEYDDSGNTIKVWTPRKATDPRHDYTSASWDSNRRPQRIHAGRLSSDGVYDVTKYDYNANGWLTFIRKQKATETVPGSDVYTYADLQITQSTYTTAGRLKKIIAPDLAETKYSYYADGRRKFVRQKFPDPADDRWTHTKYTPRGEVKDIYRGQVSKERYLHADNTV